MDLKEILSKKYNINIIDIEKNIESTDGNVYIIKTDKFKTDLLAIFITVPLDRETVTLDCLIPAVLRRGTEKYTSQEEINKKLEEMYVMNFDCGIEKI